MSLSDCEKCWSTPCDCGYDYRNYSDEEFNKFIDDISKGRLKYREQQKEENPPEEINDHDIWRRKIATTCEVTVQYYDKERDVVHFALKYNHNLIFPILKSEIFRKLYEKLDKTEKTV